MGRYYSGDIEGKFWFGVQDSNDASFFGGEVSEPNYINYYFSTGDLRTIEKGINECLAVLGDNKGRLDTFFAHLNGGYTIFGQVISGMDVVTGLTRRDPDQLPDYSGDVIESITITAE